MDIFDRIAEQKVVPIYNNGKIPDKDDEICEVTMRDANSPNIIKLCKSRGQTVGAGTILHLSNFWDAVDAGADFCITPITNEVVISEAQKQGIPFIPGACTANEVWKAIMLANVVKVFPARDIEIVIAPFLHLQKRFIATGCVNPDNYRKYLDMKGVMSVTGSSFAYKMKDLK